MYEDKKPNSRLTRYANEAKTSRKLTRMIPPLMAAAVILLVFMYLLSLLFTRYGSFTIKIKDYGDRDYALALSESDGFQRNSSRLNATEVKNITNISYLSLPNDLNDVNGSHNGENYLAYTFYVKNTGEKPCGYRYSLVVTKSTLGIDAAARVRLYYNPDYYRVNTGEYTHLGDYVDYAKPKTGGNGAPEIDEPDKRVMTNFLSADVVVEGAEENFEPGDIAKMTIVIWLEGEDPDCNDDILGGQFKVDMVVEIVGAEED